MATTVNKTNPAKYVIIHDGGVFVDRMRSPEYMAEVEEHRLLLHVEAARNAVDKAERLWRFRLRNNAARRRAYWLAEEYIA
jgi:hypothetical protein